MSINGQLGIPEDQRIYCEECSMLFYDFVVFDVYRKIFVCRECIKMELLKDFNETKVC